MLNGPRIGARSGRAKSLVVLLHGYGADGNDLIDIGGIWSARLPDTAFVAPHAGDPCAEAPTGRQWFPLAGGVDPHRLAAGVAGARGGLEAFLDAELAGLGLGGDRLLIAGFSQGAMMALDTGPRRTTAPAGIVSYSGMVAAPEALASAPHRPPVLLCHGDGDTVIPPQALQAAVQVLGAEGFPLEWHLRPGLGHGIDEAGLGLGLQFAARVLGAAIA